MRVKPDVLYTEEQIRTRVAEVAAEIGEACAGKELAIVSLLKSCLVFTADMMRAIPLETTCYFIRAHSEAARKGGLRTDIVYSVEAPYEGRHILLLDDVVDTGITLNFVIEHIVERDPASLQVCTLIDKPGERKVEVPLDWTLFKLDDPLEDRFVVGYGLDYKEHYRGVPYLGTIPRSGPRAAERTLTLTTEE